MPVILRSFGSGFSSVFHVIREVVSSVFAHVDVKSSLLGDSVLFSVLVNAKLTTAPRELTVASDHAGWFPCAAHLPSLSPETVPC